VSDVRRMLVEQGEEDFLIPGSVWTWVCHVWYKPDDNQGTRAILKKERPSLVALWNRMVRQALQALLDTCHNDGDDDNVEQEFLSHFNSAEPETEEEQAIAHTQTNNFIAELNGLVGFLCWERVLGDSPITANEVAEFADLVVNSRSVFDLLFFDNVSMDCVLDHLHEVVVKLPQDTFISKTDLEQRALRKLQPLCIIELLYAHLIHRCEDVEYIVDVM
jgi:hypothetical protein